MISICVPNLTGTEASNWAKNNTFPVNAIASGFYDPAFPTAVPAGYLIQILVDDSRWPEVRTAAASLATLKSLPRVRVVFPGLDPSKTSGRPASDVAWVYPDGHQEEG